MEKVKNIVADRYFDFLIYKISASAKTDVQKPFQMLLKRLSWPQVLLMKLLRPQMLVTRLVTKAKQMVESLILLQDRIHLVQRQ